MHIMDMHIKRYKGYVQSEMTDKDNVSQILRKINHKKTGPAAACGGPADVFVFRPDWH